MTRNILVTRYSFPSLPSEIVERKGLGHPDTICDGLSEAVSQALSKYYLDNFGSVLHHNVDKALLVAGRAKPEFGGGELISPIRYIQGGRATNKVNSEEIPVEEISRKAILDYLGKNFKNLDPNLHCDIDVILGQGSSDLTDIFKRKTEKPLANDTSFGVGYYPLSELENLVLTTENYLNSQKYKDRHPWVGEDIKIMGLREGNSIKLTVAAAFVSRHVSDLEDYLGKKEEVIQDITRFCHDQLGKQLGSQFRDKDYDIEVFLNTNDNPDRASVYLTVTGLSAENGDDGQVGRGNRGNGLITPGRPMAMEAIAGKNPTNHVGKIYNVIARDIARDIVESLPSVRFASVYLLSQIGRPIDQPLIAEARIDVQEGELSSVKGKVEYIVDQRLESIEDTIQKLIEGKVSIF